MKSWTVLGLITFLALVLLGGAGSQIVEAQAGAKKQVSYGGISFSYDASLATNVTAQMVAEPEEDVSSSLCGEGVYFAPFPQIIFKFEGYRPEGFGCPSIFIYDIHAPRKTYDPRSLAGSDIHPRVDNLRRILSQKQDLRSLPEGLQPLPSINAARIFVGGQKFVNFRTGSGVRYLVHITHDVSPFAAGETVYTYQGLSDDGRYYVGATFPAWLAAHPPTPGPTTNESVEDYNRRVSEEVDRASNNAFTPDLDALDAIFLSLRTDAAAGTQPSGATRPMPRAGHPMDNGWMPGAALLGLLSLLAGAGLARRQARPR